MKLTKRSLKRDILHRKYFDFLRRLIDPPRVPGKSLSVCRSIDKFTWLGRVFLICLSAALFSPRRSVIIKISIPSDRKSVLSPDKRARTNLHPRGSIRPRLEDGMFNARSISRRCWSQASLQSGESTTVRWLLSESFKVLYKKVFISTKYWSIEYVKCAKLWD